MFEYTLILNSQQAREVLKAVEFLMRLKIRQEDVIPYTILNIDDINEYCKRRDNSKMHLKYAFDELFPTIDDIKKDDEWYRLYNLYQSVRYALHKAETPNSKGVDSYPPIQFTDEPIPECNWKKIEEKHEQHRTSV